MPFYVSKNKQKKKAQPNSFRLIIDNSKFSVLFITSTTTKIEVIIK